MATARKLIKRSLQVAGILTKNEQPAADEAADALSVLNGMLGSWSNDGLLVYHRPLEEFSLTGGVAEYTIGPSATFNTQRPIRIVSAYIRQGTTDYPLTQIPEDQYDVFAAQKDLPSIPYRFTYDNNHPVAKMRIIPTPSTDYPIFIRSEKILSQFDTLDDNVNLPPGWDQALVYNLAMMLAPEYGQQVDQMVFKTAGDSLGAIKAAVARNRSMDTPPLTGMGTFDIYSGRYWH